MTTWEDDKGFVYEGRRTNMTLNTVPLVVAAMEPPNDQNATVTGAVHPSAMLSYNMPPSGTATVEAWGQVYTDQTNAYPTNVRAAIKNMETYIWSISQNRWVNVQAVLSPGGALYTYNFTSHIAGNKRTESDGSVSISLQSGYLFHFFPVTHATITESDVGGVFTTVQARLILDNPSGPDNIDSTRWVADVGADFYASGTAYSFNGSPNVGVGGGRFMYLTRNWQALSFYTGGPSSVINASTTKYPAQAWTETRIQANPPPMDGMGTPSGSTPPADTTPPSLVTATRSASSNQIVLTYNETLASTPPDVGDFSVLVNGSTAVVTGVSISGQNVIVTLAITMAASDNVQISYDPNGIAPPASTNWTNAVAYTQTRPSFTPTRTVNVTSASQLTSAVNAMQAGDLIQNVQPGGFAVPNEFTISNKNLASPAVIDLKTGADAVRFTGYPTGSTSFFPSVYLFNNKNVRIYGGDVTNPGGYQGINWNYGMNTCLWWDVVIHDTGGDSIAVLPTQSGSPIQNCDIYVKDASNWGLTPTKTDSTGKTMDPHSEKGTGLHGCQFSDTSGLVTTTRFAGYFHDASSGAGLQYGTSGGVGTTNNTLYLKVERNNKVSTQQFGGGGVNLWGHDPISGTIQYLEVNDCQGRAIFVDTEYNATFSNVTVQYARAHNTSLNPKWASGPTFMVGPTYIDVAVV